MNQTSRCRLIVVLAGVSLGTSTAVWALSSALASAMTAMLSPGRASTDAIVTAVSAATALALMAWLGAGLLCSVISALPGPLGMSARRARDRIAPGAVRRWASLLLGVAIVSTIAPGGAVATPIVASRTLDQNPVEESSVRVSPAAPVPDWLPSDEPPPAPDWVPSTVRPQPPVSLTPTRQLRAQDEPSEVTVRRGDTLWDLAAAYLSPEASDAEIATEWQRWYAANRDVIGSDPDLILPGQVLVIPALEAAASRGVR